MRDAHLRGVADVSRLARKLAGKKISLQELCQLYMASNQLPALADALSAHTGTPPHWFRHSHQAAGPSHERTLSSMAASVTIKAVSSCHTTWLSAVAHAAHLHTHHLSWWFHRGLLGPLCFARTLWPSTLPFCWESPI